MRDYTTIKQSLWLNTNFPELKKKASLFFSNQYKNHEYLNLSDYSYLRFSLKEGQIEGDRLPSWTGMQLFKELPLKIDKFSKKLDSIENYMVVKYEDENGKICPGKGFNLISIGENFVDICFDMFTRIKERDDL